MTPIIQTPRKARFWTRTRLFVTALSFALLAAAGSSCNREGTTGANVSVTTGKTATGESTAPDLGALPQVVFDQQLQDINGNTFRLADYAGKVVVVDLWATWCGPCRDEIPHLNELSREYGPRGLEVIGLTVEDRETDAQAVRNFMSAFKIAYRVGWSERAFANAIRRGDTIPQTFVIGRDGRLVKYYLGFTKSDLPPGTRGSVATPSRMREVLEQALGASGT